MAENKSRYRRFVEYLQAPPQRELGQKSFINQTNYSLDGQIYGYNSSSGFVPDKLLKDCLLYTSPSPRDYAASRMPSSA